MSASLNTKEEYLGFWETAVLEADGLRVDGWALRSSEGAPDVFVIRWGDNRYEVAPNTVRTDVVESLGWGIPLCGVHAVIPLPKDVMADWSLISMSARWGAFTTELPLNYSTNIDDLKLFRFSSFDDFQNSFQNPAFRVSSPILQAQGAARALRLSGKDRIYWMAAATVALYRSFLDGIFPRAEAEKIVQQWDIVASDIRSSAEGIELRWATSMHLASGYANLAWGDYEAASKQFGAVVGYSDRIQTWPQVTTNVGIGTFIGAWLLWRKGNIEAALALLEPSLRLFQDGTAALQIWNWYMYEELRGALDVSQMCFTFLKRLDGLPMEHIVPSQVKLELSKISAVMKSLIDKGMIVDEALP